ncbi:MAG: xanthine dehydrogenase family protein [Gammaproteobacteria bacterium]|nr:xanthine dehydrogenase family protein [Gammaproteobacteria bacterium]
MSANLADNSQINDIIGASVPRIEGPEKATGRAVYTDDITRPGMLHAALLGSHYAHARILSIDTSRARALAGVKAVLTGADLPLNYIGMFIKDQLPLATDTVRYAGEPVAAVAAVDLKTAKQALQLVEVEYEELEPVFDVIKAMEPGAPVIHEKRDEYPCMFELPREPNAMCFTEFMEGDPNAAWDECDAIVEAEYRIPAQYHAYMEPSSTVAEMDGNGKITLWSSTQGVARSQMYTAMAMGLPMSKVRVIAPRVGGGFGGKCEFTNQPITALLARATGRPVKLTYSREDDMTMMKRRHGGVIYMKTGAAKDGTLLARDCRIVLDGGAYADESPEVSPVAAFFSRGPYRIPNMRAEAWAVYTNLSRASAFRGFGNPQATFASESQLDDLAEKLDMDPLELRMRNALEQEDKFFCGKTIESATMRACLEKVRDASDWKAKRTGGLPARRGKRRGIGMAGMTHISGLAGAGANVLLNEDGSVSLNCGAVDIGQGSDTIFTQIVAGSLALNMDQVNFAAPDTDSSPFQFQTSASRNTYVIGNAVKLASDDVREQICRHASEIFECDRADLEFRQGGIVGVKGVPDAALPFAAVAGRALWETGGPIMGTHNWLYAPQERMDPKRMVLGGFALMPDSIGIFTFGAQVAEVEVDEVTGQVEVLEFWAAHDVGRAINTASVEGQIEGGIVQMLGYALTEEMLWDNGRMINPTMMDYKIPGMADVPLKIHTLLIESPEASAPFGAKGVGEICAVGPAPAVANAIRNAIGVRINEIPATPERVLRAMLSADDAG